MWPAYRSYAGSDESASLFTRAVTLSTSLGSTCKPAGYPACREPVSEPPPPPTLGDVSFMMLRFCSQLRHVRLSSASAAASPRTTSAGYIASQFSRSLVARWRRVSRGTLPLSPIRLAAIQLGFCGRENVGSQAGKRGARRRCKSTRRWD